MTKKEFLTREAMALINSGVCSIIVDSNKKAVSAWKPYAVDMPTREAIDKMASSVVASGVAIVCGPVSGGLEVLDFDLKNAISRTLWADYLKLIPPPLRDRLRIVRTRSNGFHIYYRCEQIEGNKKLASRKATPEELAANPHQKQLVVIETRGEGGYVVAPPSEGYSIEVENPIPLISITDRELLLEVARSFNEVHTEERARFTTTGVAYGLSPFDDYNSRGDALEVLLSHGWTIVNEDVSRIHLRRPGNTTARTSGNYHKDKKLFYVWTTSTEFTPEKAYSPAAIYSVLKHNGDHSLAAKALIREGYGAKLTDRGLKKAIDNPIEIDYKFWTVTINKDGYPKIEINLLKLVRFLNKVGGFASYRYNEDAANIIVRIKDGLVSEAGVYDVKQFLMSFMDTLPDTFEGITPEDLINEILDNHLANFTKNFFEFLPEASLKFLRDTKDEAYFPFSNGIVKVESSGASFKRYNEIDGVIWKSQLIDREISLYHDLTSRLDTENIDFSNFLWHVSGTPEAYAYFISVVGYLLHKYKDPKSAYAVILAEKTDNEAEGGGTGKGLFIKAIKQLIPTEVMDGKQFSAGKSFAMQRVSLDTKIIALEDVRKSFKFEDMYSMITEGLTVEKKNQKEFFIPYCDSPKFTISTNYAIADDSNHSKRRQKVLEFTGYFGPHRTPYDEFGKMFFDDWDESEYNRFFNFMVFCCYEYLRDGIPEMGQSESNKNKNIKIKFGEDLPIFFEDKATLLEEGAPLQNLYAEFVERFTIDTKFYNRDRFAKGIKYIGSLKGYDSEIKPMKYNGILHRTIFLKKIPS